MNSLLPTTPEGASSGAELVTSDGRQLALVSAQLRGEAQGGLARLVLEQRFANPYDDTLRVTYRMPLPADGAVSGYEFVIGERVVKGVVDKKKQARERFERAIVEGRTAALLEQERADIFTQQIGNIPPREEVLARITIDQRLVWLPEGEWELRFPTVIGPRYIGSADTAADVRATHIKVAEKISATIQIELAIRDAITAGAKPHSPSHLIDRRGDVIELKSGSRLDRDIVVRWPVATPAPGLSLASARPQSGNDAYALLTIVPPAKEAKPLAVPRDLIVLLDTSGSMSGGPLDKAKQVVCMMIDSLDEQDRLELIEFSNSPSRYLDEPVQATAAAKAAAIKWVRSREADGGTEMRKAVVEALTTLRVGAQRQVLVVTDGYVGGEHQILEALNRRLPKSCRLHVLGVGSAVNRSLATSLARAGRGTEVIVGIDEDAERGAKRLLDRTRFPMLTNVEISGSALLRHAPALVPDVFEGAPLVCALAIKPEGGELLVKGQLARDTWEQRITVKPLAVGTGNQAIVALYGRERVADVEATSLFSSVDGEIEDLGLTFQIATRMTSWVAIDEIRRNVGFTREQLVPQELPYGTSAAAFGLRGPGAARPAPAAMNMVRSFAKESFVEAKRDLAESLAVDASISPAAGEFADEEATGDFGEEAPAEMFGDDAYAPAGFGRYQGEGGAPEDEDDALAGAPMRSTTPPPAAYSRPPAPTPGYSAPRQPAPPPARRGAPPAAPGSAARRPPASPSSIMPRAPEPPGEFDLEEPTGQMADAEKAERAEATRRPSAAAPAARPAARARTAPPAAAGAAPPRKKSDTLQDAAPPPAEPAKPMMVVGSAPAAPEPVPADKPAAAEAAKREPEARAQMQAYPSEAQPKLKVTRAGGPPPLDALQQQQLEAMQAAPARKKSPMLWLAVLAALALLTLILWWLLS